MDLFALIPSADVREYLAEKQYRFTPEDTFRLLRNSPLLLAERIREIRACGEALPESARTWCDRQEEAAEAFLQTTDRAVYEGVCAYFPDGRYGGTVTFSAELGSVLENFRQEMPDFLTVEVTKWWLDQTREECCARLFADGTLLVLSGEADGETAPALPCPFRKGDAVEEVSVPLRPGVQWGEAEREQPLLFSEERDGFCTCLGFLRGNPELRAFTIPTVRLARAREPEKMRPQLQLVADFLRERLPLPEFLEQYRLEWMRESAEAGLRRQKR